MPTSHTPPFGPLKSAPSTHSPSRTWRPLRFLNLYRFTLATLFVVLQLLGELPKPLGSIHPDLFHHTSLAYLGFSLVAMYLLGLRKPPFLAQLHLHILADIVFITLWMHASGGVSSGVGMLLVVSVANGSMIAAGRVSGLFAALATIAILLEQIYSEFSTPSGAVNYPLAGLLGATLFATAVLAHVLARRAHESEALARQRSIDLANMAQLTEYIIQHMQTGVMVVDPDNRVRLMNGAAWYMLGTPLSALPVPLLQISIVLSHQLQQWQHAPHREKVHLQVEGTPNELLAQFLAIGKEHDDGILIFLEDAATTTNQAQQLKLASLGRLTASIAHEIRNPLGAISHAGALLAESPELGKADRRLTEIIAEQSRRINTIVENVLQLGRRDRARSEALTLKPWLERFIDELEQANPDQAGQLKLELDDPELAAHFDPNQLQQLLLNLCLNGLRHAEEKEGRAKVTLRGGRLDERFGHLDIIDTGPGISEAHRGQIFEPFFTTESSGTGLGLYLARELAEGNHAQLRYEPTAEGESRFRLVFRLPERDNRAHEP
ncbi:MAG: sensor histidine kinase [Pseudomonadota bacterium]